MRHFLKLATTCFLLAAGTPFAAKTMPSSTIQVVPEDEALMTSLRGQVLYAMNRGQIDKSVSLYFHLRDLLHKDDYELLQQMGRILLTSGTQSQDPEELLLTLFGAAITGDPSFLTLFEQALASNEPNLQMASIHLLMNFNDDRADALLKKALASPFLPIRFEAAFALSKKKQPSAFGQIEALMYKVDPRLKLYFPTLFALEGSKESMAVLRQFLNDPDRLVRLEALLNLTLHDRDDFLPQIRALASHVDISQQEMCAFALGHLKDQTAMPLLERLANSSQLQVKLAACMALYRLGRISYQQPILQEAIETHNLFAIQLLGEIKNMQDPLFELTRDKDPQVRINAALALLNLCDERCEKVILELLLTDPRDMSLHKLHSDGRSLSAWKWLSSASLAHNNSPYELELAMVYKEAVLQSCLDLPQKTFLHLSAILLQRGPRSLIPLVVELLENLQSEEAHALLKNQIDRAGAPLIRGYSLLSLYRLDPQGPYLSKLIETVKELQQTALIRFRPLMPWKVRKQKVSLYTLTPEEQSRLFINTMLTLASQKDPAAIDILLKTITEGNRKNRAALAGLLIRASE